jgi:ubiquinone biosynthesis monooxygenase Coq7
MTERNLTPVDIVIGHLDLGMRTLFGKPVGERPSPARDTGEASSLSDADRRRSAAMMRVNHCGEVCAQALYQGQALTARSGDVRSSMDIAAHEEIDHLQWCQQRLEELGSHTSYLNPLWYSGALGLGLLAGLAGDKWSLGFLAETERQVVRHLDGHLDRLPVEDRKSRDIVTQMKEDEARHATMAVTEGAMDLPGPFKRLMALSARVMTTVAAGFNKQG